LRCDDLRLIQAWLLQWGGCGVTFEIVPVVASSETRAVVESYLDEPEPRISATRPRLARRS
jgi:hypothetical protein